MAFVSGNSVLLLCAQQGGNQDFLGGGFLLIISQQYLLAIYPKNENTESFLHGSRNCSNKPMDEQHHRLNKIVNQLFID